MDYLSGMIWAEEPFEGYVGVENGIVMEIGEGKPPSTPIAEGNVMSGLLDGHTHVGDAGLVVDGKYTLEQLVAPPDGLKHRYLCETPISEIKRNMSAYTDMLAHSGVSRFMDFREGGIEGVRALRSVTSDAVILGRPVSSTYDSNETDLILSEADGIGISSISDMSLSYAEAIADSVHRAGKILAIHVSERVREDIDLVLSLQPDFVVHMCLATDDDMRKCADADVPVVVCPRSNLYFERIPPLRCMHDSGMDVFLGTDNAMLCSPDLFAEAKVFDEIAQSQGCDPRMTTYALTGARHKLLNERQTIGLTVGSAVDAVVTGLAMLNGSIARLR